MALNINNLNSSVQIKQQVQQHNEVKQQASQATNNSEQTKQAGLDSVSLTPQAKQLSELQKKSSEKPVIDQKKIAELQKAIASGEYKINPEKLASNILKFELNLI